MDTGFGGGVTEDDFLEDFGDTGVLDEDFVDDFVTAEEPQVEPLNEFTEPVSAKDLGFEDSEDEQQIRELRGQLKDDGYEVSDDLDFNEMEVLHSRLFKDVEREQKVLSEFVASQKEQLDALLTEVQSKQATLLPAGVDYTTLQEESAFSVDSALGRDLCVAVSRWVNNALREDPEITNEEVYEAFVATHDNFKSRIALHSDLLRRYIYTYIPIVRENIERNYNAIRSNNKTRSRLARYLNRLEIENTEALMSAKSYSVIRQIYEYNDGHFETVCPVCGARVKLNMPVFRIIAFASEASPRKRVFVGHIGCECGNALLFKSEEYALMFKNYRSECFSGIDAYVNEAKTVSQGAVELITSIPISVVKDYLPFLFVYANDDTTSKRVVVDRDEVEDVIVVDDKEFEQAVKQFYFKLHGICRPAYAEAVTSQVVEAVQENSTSTIAGGASGMAVSPSVYWTYHDTTVYVMQCLSKEYYTEHKRALFSLITSINSNPHLAAILTCKDIWELQDAIVFLSQFKNRKNVRTLLPVESNQLKFYIMSVAKQKYLGDDKLLEQAIECLDVLKTRLGERVAERKSILAAMRAQADIFAFTKLLRMNSCSAEDLQQYLGDHEAAMLFNEIADRMLIKAYSGDFFEYWKSFGIVRVNTLNNVFEIRSDITSVRDSLEKLHGKLFYKPSSLQKFKVIYDRDAVYETEMSKLHRDYVNVDFYNFCKDLASVNIDNVNDNSIFEMIVQLSKACNVEQIVKKTKAEVYLSDFSPEEIASCPACNELVFGRYIPIRRDGETIDNYCKRFEQEANDKVFLNVRDVRDMFAPCTEWVLKLSTCSIITDAEFRSRGKSVFMDALLCEACGDSNCADFLTAMLGVSQMQQNIIKAINADYVSFEDTATQYKILHGIYMSSAYVAMEKWCEDAAETNVFASMSAKQMVDLLDYKSKFIDLAFAEAKVTDDGEVLDDRDEVLAELSDYYGDGDLMEWLGINA